MWVPSFPTCKNYDDFCKNYVRAGWFSVIHFAICDDDSTMTGSLERMLLALEPQYETKFEVSVFFSGEEFCDHLDQTGERFDIVLMDIEMRAITGVEAGLALRENIANEHSLLIFISSHKSYYEELLDLHVFCFIPKPIFMEEFNLKIGRAIQHVLNQRERPPSPDFEIKINQRNLLVPLHSILYLESEVRQIRLHTTDETHTYYGRLDEEEAKLPSHMFCRIHKSHLVNFGHVKTITTKDVVMADDRRFSISEAYRDHVKIAYMQYRWREKQS